MRRGDICLVDLEPSRGSEADKRRPAVVVSNDAANRAAQRQPRAVITVVPLTSNVQRILPFQVLLPSGETGLSRDSKAQAEQVRAVSMQRIAGVIGRVPAQRMRELDDALVLHLGLS